MGLFIEYKTDDPRTKVTRLSFLFNGIPHVISWESDSKTEDGNVTQLSCYNLHLPGEPELTEDMAKNAVLTGGMWFGPDGKPYTSGIEFLKAEFFSVGPRRQTYPVKIQYRGKGAPLCGMQ